MDLGGVRVVGNTPTVAERFGDGGNVPGEDGAEHPHPGQVLGTGAAEADGVLSGEPESPSGGVVLEDARGDHRAEPLADIPFLQPGASGELVAGGGTGGRGVEQSGAAPDIDQVGEHRAGEQPEQLSGELLGRLLVDVGGGHDLDRTTGRP